jgi:hypothetical protein
MQLGGDLENPWIMFDIMSWPLLLTTWNENPLTFIVF